MDKYKVTIEIKTPIWKKILRWFRIMPKMETFELLLGGDYYNVGELLSSGDNDIKIIEKL